MENLLWFICKYCHRAYKEKGGLILHKKREHLEAFKIEKSIRKKAKKDADAKLLSLSKPNESLIEDAPTNTNEVVLSGETASVEIVDVETGHTEVGEIELIDTVDGKQEIELGPREEGVEIASANEDTVDVDIDANDSSVMNPDQSQSDQIASNDGRDSLKEVNKKRRRRRQHLLNPRKKPKTRNNRLEEDDISISDQGRAESVSTEETEDLKNPQRGSRSGKKAISEKWSHRPQQDTNEAAQDSLQTDNASSDLSGTVTASNDFENSTVIDLRRADEHNESDNSNSNSNSYIQSRYNTRVKIEKISYTESQSCRKCLKLFPADEIDEHRKECVRLKCKHCRFLTTSLDELEYHDVTKHASVPKEKAKILSIFKVKPHAEREKKTGEKEKKVKSLEIGVVEPCKKKKKGSSDSASDPSDFLCDICNKSFRSLARLTKHSRKHHSNSPIKNRALSQSPSPSKKIKFHNVQLFTRESKSLKMKLIKMTQPSQSMPSQQGYACNLCNETFINVTSGRIHGRTHAQESPYACNSKHCIARFKSIPDLRLHQRSEHLPSNRKTNSLELGLQFENISDQVIKKPQPRYHCETCGKEFVKKAWFQSHVQLHCKNKDQEEVKSSHNGHQLPTYTAVTEAEGGSETESEFICEFCGKKYSSEPDLKHHEDIHRFGKMSTKTELVSAR